MKSDRTTLLEVLAECKKYYTVKIYKNPKKIDPIPNGSALLAKRQINLYVKSREEYYNFQTSVLIHEYGHILDFEYRLASGSLFIPTDYECEVAAWEAGEEYFTPMGLIPKNFHEIKEHCLRTHRQHRPTKH